jgi:hypothetical protein
VDSSNANARVSTKPGQLHQQNDFAAATEDQWVVGFLSGLGYEGQDPMAGTDYNGVAMWISNYCAANPTMEIIDAAEAFAKSRAPATN